MKNKVPKPKNPDDALSQMEAFIEIVKLLRRDCPWDNKQTHKSISHLLIEETYETIDAINQNDMKEFPKELGDLLLHIVMHSVIAEENGNFNFAKVISKVSEKMVRRHPHVFELDESYKAETEEEVLNNWETIKMKEGRKSALEGVPKNLPSLLKAERIQEKAARVGFDWDNKQDVWAKVEEEFLELKQELASGAPERKEEEFGDLIFALVNAARFEKIVPEEALQLTNLKFIKRFQYVEKRAKEENLKLTEMTLAEMDKFWDEAKNIEKN